VGRTAHILRQTKSAALISSQSKGHVYGGLAAQIARTPGFFWQQGIPSPSLIERVAAHVPATTIVAGSKAAVDAQRYITPRSQVELVHPGVETEEIAARIGVGKALRRQLGLEDSPLVGIVGRLQPWKGQMIFLQAAAKIAEVRPDVRFLVVGGAILGWEGGYPDDLEMFVRESPMLRDRVQFVGHQADVYPWFDALDVVVHASTNEPFGLVLVEAMALGKPLVATGSGGPLEIVVDGESGVLVPPGNSTVMAQEITRILGDPALSAHLSQGANQAVGLFSARRMAENWASLLEKHVEQGVNRA